MKVLFKHLKSVLILTCLIFLIPPLYAQQQTDSSDSSHCALVQRLFSEGYNQRNLNMLSDVIAVDYLEQLNGIESKGVISIIKSVKWLEQVAPDFKISIEDMLCKDDKVVVRWNYKGTDTKYNKYINLSGIYIAQIENEKIVRGWQVFDNYQRFVQLGYTFTAPEDSLSGESQ